MQITALTLLLGSLANECIVEDANFVSICLTISCRGCNLEVTVASYPHLSQTNIAGNYSLQAGIFQREFEGALTSATRPWWLKDNGATALHWTPRIPGWAFSSVSNPDGSSAFLPIGTVGPGVLLQSELHWQGGSWAGDSFPLEPSVSPDCMRCPAGATAATFIHRANDGGRIISLF